ncbi:MAG: hypothetical protein M3P24_06245 [Gemmatimonadota bacterium]|nr:hypothetical protein [Gemmatimonadota bacterium]
MRRTLFLFSLLLPACTADAGTDRAAGDAAAECRVLQRDVALPSQVRETSGLALSRRHPGILWTHNDSGGEPVLFAVDTAGALRGQVQVAGAKNKDWEDVAAGPCPGGECLYLGDIGDNADKRKDVEVYRVPEPAPGDAVTAPTERITLRYPDEPQDAESLFVLPSGDLYLVTKGRRKAVALYRAPAPLPAGGTVTLRRVTALDRGEEKRLNQVTGAGATHDGRWVAVRTYSSLHLFRAEALVGGSTPTSERIDLGPLEEAQGEAVAVREDGTVFLTSEGQGKKSPGTLSRLSCTLR